MMPLKICIIGKYPPIEGGVSRDTFWMAHALASAGHEVHVVTNAHRVEAEYRISEPAALSDLRPVTPPNLFVHNVQPIPQHIPTSPAYVSSLAGLASTVIERNGCDFILAYYFEPYLPAAFLASKWTNKPFGARHSGSDVGRLMLNTELAATYSECLIAADFVLSSPSLVRGHIGLGVLPERIFVAVPGALPTTYFSPTAPVKDVDALASEDQVSPEAQSHPPPRDLTVGLYGKIGRSKGTWDLLAALKELQGRGVAFHLRAMIGGSEEALAEFHNRIRESRIANHVTLVPFLPHWAVPSFIRSCVAVCFLERDFEVVGHKPIVPREVLACGTCLILSSDIAPAVIGSADRHNMLIADPRNLQSLTDTLAYALEDPIRSNNIGLNGWRELSSGREDFEKYTAEVCRLFEDINQQLGEERHSMSIAELQACLARLCGDESFRKAATADANHMSRAYSLTSREVECLTSIDARLLEQFADLVKAKRFRIFKARYPLTLKAAPDAVIKHWTRFFSVHPPRPFESATDYALSFASFLVAALAEDSAVPTYAASVGEFETLLFRSSVHGQSLNPSAVGSDRRKKIEAMQRDYFRLAGGVWIGTFEVNIIEIAESLARGESPRATEGGCKIVVQQRPNSLRPNILRVAEGTYKLLEAARDGVPLFEVFSERDGVGEAIEELRRQGLLVAPPASEVAS